jgi:S1-C subfamily serine protease
VQEPRSLVGQILPKTLAGLAVWILLFAAGVAASGVILFFWYNYRLEITRKEILAESTNFKKDAEAASKRLQELAKESQSEIERVAGGAGSTGQEITKILERVGPAVAHVQGKSGDGAGSSGSGFVVLSNERESWVLTTYGLVAGSVAEKSAVNVSFGGDRRQATVYSWDPSTDLALIIIRAGGIRALTDWANQETAIGTRVWAIGTSPGQLSSAAAQGYLLDNSEAGLLTDADVPSNATGGPLVDRDAKVLGVLSLTYAPQGYTPSNGWAVPIRNACRRVLRCPEG